MAVDQKDLMAELARLREENQKLKAKETGPLALKVSQKGAVSVYGLGRWPVTLYRSQMERFLGEAERIKAFMVEHADQLKTKE